MAYHPIIINLVGSPVIDPFADQFFTVAGNQLAAFIPGTSFVVYDNNSPVSNVYAFSVLSASFNGANTEVTPTTSILDISPYTYQQAVDGGYTIQWSDCSKTPVTIDVATINSLTSLNLPGRGVTSYGEAINTNLLHLLENFAGPYSPDDPLNPCNTGSPLTVPVVGQLWFDTSGSPPQNVIRVWDGTVWSAFDGTGTGHDFLSGSSATTTTLANDTVTAINVPVQAITGGLAFQQVFYNGILQREDVAGFPNSGNYYINGQDIIFAFSLDPTDEILAYAL